MIVTKEEKENATMDNYKAFFQKPIVDWYIHSRWITIVSLFFPMIYKLPNPFGLIHEDK